MSDNQQGVQEFSKSKSQVKREFLDLQNLAKQLIALPERRLKNIPLSERAYQEIVKAKDFKRIHLKRQLRYLGGLLVHEPVAEIRQALDALLSHQHTQTAEHHQAEQWRERLLLETGNDCLTEIVEHHPAVDLQALRHLVRAAKKEQAHIEAEIKAQGEPKTPKTQYRKLFRFLASL